MDDGSTDKTASNLAKIQSRQLRVINSANTVGIVGALNALIGASDSEYVARMDADDICLPRRFSLQQRAAERSDFVFTSVVFINQAGWPLRPDFPGRISPEAVPLHLLLGNFLVHPTMFAKRRSLLEAGAYRSAQAEDYDLWLRVAASGGRIERLAEPGLLYRRHEMQVSVTGDWKSRGSDPVLDASYERLLASAIGFKGDSSALRLASIHGRSIDIDPLEKQAFKSALRAHARKLPLSQQLLLRGRLLQANRHWLGA